jgi:hypothetical protein
VSSYDLDLHGFVTIKLLGAAPAQTARLAWELGVSPSSSDAADGADITIEFVDDLLPPSGAVWLGDDAADADAGLFIASADRRRPRWMQLEPSEIGETATVRCDRRLSRVPYLQDLLNLVLLARGTPAIHAASFAWNGNGVLAGGWSGGRKTDVLLSVVRAGATAMADEWTILEGSPLRMTGLASPVRLVGRHLSLLPDVGRLPASRRARMLVGTKGAGAIRAVGGDHAIARGLERRIRGRSHFDVAPERLFAERHAPSKHAVACIALIQPTNDRRPSLHPIATADVARRLAHVHADHRRQLTSRLDAFGYVAPDRISDRVRRAIDGEARLLDGLLTHTEAYLLRVPAVIDPDAIAAVVSEALPG